MFKKILLCTDGSEQALHAARLTANLACRVGASVCLVHVLDLLVATGPFALAPDAGPPAEITLQYAQEAQQAILQHIGQIFEHKGIPFQACAEMGNPVERIVQIAEQEHADVIVIGSRGLSAWKALLLGSVSEGVAHHAHCPVLIVRGEPESLHQLVVASDGSEGANHALKVGFELAKQCQAALTVLNVFQPLASYPGVSEDDLDPDVYAARVHEAVTRQVEPIAKETEMTYRLCQEDGHPAETLVNFAEREKADLIVLGSRGLGGFRRLLLGSVCDGVMHHAHCSVLIVR